MSTKTRHFFLYLILLLLSGQALAGPFLRCPRMSMAAYPAMAVEDTHGHTAAMAEHCAGMLVSAADADAALDADSGHSLPMPGSSLQESVEMDADCDPGCRLLCLGAAAPALPVAALLQAAAPVPSLVQPADMLAPAQCPDVHFRPPISA